MNGALFVAATLMIQSFDNQVHLASHLDAAQCEIARCQAQFGKSCGQQIHEGVANWAYRFSSTLKEREWEIKNPKTFAACKADRAWNYDCKDWARGSYPGSIMVNVVSFAVNSVRYAQCIREEPAR